mmetsp:Transcript_3221/g.7648  ORF Transcript_3221/g.7648 Transcript_3221/m.7648 type:complete len:248 (-) Transcript_3221:289-1032(-)
MATGGYLMRESSDVQAFSGPIQKSGEAVPHVRRVPFVVHKVDLQEIIRVNGTPDERNLCDVPIHRRRSRAVVHSCRARRRFSPTCGFNTLRKHPAERCRVIDIELGVPFRASLGPFRHLSDRIDNLRAGTVGIVNVRRNERDGDIRNDVDVVVNTPVKRVVLGRWQLVHTLVQRRGERVEIRPHNSLTGLVGVTRKSGAVWVRSRLWDTGVDAEERCVAHGTVEEVDVTALDVRLEVGYLEPQHRER